MTKPIYNQNICQYRNCGKLTSNAKYCDLKCCTSENNAIASEKAITKNKQALMEYSASPKLCKGCKKRLPFKSRNVYCGLSCSAKETNKSRTVTSRLKQAATLRKDKNPPIKKSRKPQNSVKKYPYTKIKWHVCEITGQLYCNKNSSGNVRQISPFGRELRELYYILCRFKFNVYQLPEYFNIALIEEFGWYSCPGQKRKGQPRNIKGVSRDHLYSISTGIQNRVHPLILSHPANCELMIQLDNVSKHSGCSILIDQLIKKIMAFDNSKGLVPNHDKIIELIITDKIYLGDFEVLRKFF